MKKVMDYSVAGGWEQGREWDVVERSSQSSSLKASFKADGGVTMPGLESIGYPPRAVTYGALD